MDRSAGSSATTGRRGSARRCARKGKAKSRYEKAIAELEAAREGLKNEATLLNWLSTGDIGEASSPLAFTRTLEELHRDCEHLADAHPATRDERIPEPQWQLAHGLGARGLRVSGPLWEVSERAFGQSAHRSGSRGRSLAKLIERCEREQGQFFRERERRPQPRFRRRKPRETP
jgi:hypothetical protein